MVQDVAAEFAEQGVTYAHGVTYDDLSAETLQALNAVSASVKKQWYSLPEDVRNAIEGTNPKFRLYKLPNGGLGALALFTTQAIREDEAVLAYAGKLHELKAWEEKHPDHIDGGHLWSFDLPAEGLNRIGRTVTGYKGPDLVLAGDERGNQGRYIQDSTWHGTEWPARSNMYANIVWTTGRNHPNQVLPYVVLRAQQDLRYGRELLLYWGDNCWEAISQRDVVAQAAASWWSHYFLRELEARVGALRKSSRGKAVPLPTPKAPARKGTGPGPSTTAGPGPSTAAGPGPSTAAGPGPSTAAGPGPSTAAGPGPSTAAGPGPSTTASLGPSTAAGGAVVFSRETCKYFNDKEEQVGVLRLAPDEFDLETGSMPADGAFRSLSLEEVQQVFPGFRPQSSFSPLSAGLVKKMDTSRPRKAPNQHPATEAEEALMASGDMPGCVVAEVTALHHSVRWATTPDEKAYTVLAQRRFLKGTPLGIYGGNVCTAHKADLANNPEKEVYCFEIKAKELRREFPAIKWPAKGLVVDSLRRGNMARFINGVWGQDRSCKANVAAEILWSAKLKRPFIMLYASRTISKGDELMLDYGPHYWLFFARTMQIQQHDFFTNTNARIEALEGWLRQVEGDERAEAIMKQVAAGTDYNSRVMYDGEEPSGAAA